MIRILNKRNFPHAVDISYPSPLSNPYHVGMDGSREQVIEKYRDLAEGKMEGDNAYSECIGGLAERYRRDGRLDITAYCQVHGDVVKEMILEVARNG